MVRKILVSPGFGAGFVSWCHDGPEAKRFCLEYPPFIAALEGPEPAEYDRAAAQSACDEVTRRYYGEAQWAEAMRNRKLYPGAGLDCDDIPARLLPANPAFVYEYERRFPGHGHPYLGGLRDLRVVEVPDGKRVIIDEYDGSESVRIEGDEDGWL